MLYVAVSAVAILTLLLTLIVGPFGSYSSQDAAVQGRSDKSGTVNSSESTTVSTPGVLGLPRIPWDGGPAYWKQFQKADASSWSSPDFFPISVFLGKPSHATALKSIGVNTFLGAEHDGSTIDSITSEGIAVIPQDEWTNAEVGSDQGAVGWFVSDECDIGLGCSGGDATANLIDQRNKVARVRASNDARFAFANYSNGILDTYWAGGVMGDLMSVVDAASNDKYMYTSPFVDEQVVHSPNWPEGANPVSSGAYGWEVDQMRKSQSPAGIHPNWIIIETATPLLNDAGSRVITPGEIEGAAWSSIIHEARGIVYFQHNNGPTCGYYSLVDCDPDRLNQIKDINSGIRSLAPVINSQSYRYSFNSSTDTMLKIYDGSAYIFADIGLNQAPGVKDFSLPVGIAGATATVVGENRTIPITRGTFSDFFESEYTHHTYKITL